MELKSCPFCGGDGSVSISPKEKIIYGSCWNCGARGPAIKYKDCPTDYKFEDAIEEWNWRCDNG